MIDLTALSRTVSHALRHEPWIYELELDAHGWVPVASLLVALREMGRGWQEVDRADLERMIAMSAKQRHELRGDAIRARYGHSVPGLLAKEPAIPPPVLFHGTSPDAYEAILQRGLVPMGRNDVHLSVDTGTAIEVGRRKSKHPVVLEVDTARARAAGSTFSAGNDVVWLADNVPSECLDVIDP